MYFTFGSYFQRQSRTFNAYLQNQYKLCGECYQNYFITFRILTEGIILVAKLTDLENIIE